MSYPLSPLATVSKNNSERQGLKTWVIYSYWVANTAEKKYKNNNNHKILGTHVLFLIQEELYKLRPTEKNMFWVEISYINQLTKKKKKVSIYN